MNPARNLSSSLVLCVCASSGAVCAAPSADEASSAARQRYRDGAADYAAGRYREAIVSFRDANRIAPSAALSFDVGRAYDRLGDAANALSWYRDYLRRAPESREREEAEARYVEPVRERVRRAGLQELTVDTAPSGADVSVDGDRAERTPWTFCLPPGAHRLAARKDGFVEADRDVVVSLDAASDVVLSLANAEPGDRGNASATVSAGTPSPASTSPGGAKPARSEVIRRETSPVRTAGWITVGVGGAALGSAVVLEILRRNAESAASDDPTQIGYSEKRDTMLGRRNAARILAGAGAGVLATGAVLVLVGKPRESGPRADLALGAGPGFLGAHLNGSFQ